MSTGSDFAPARGPTVECFQRHWYGLAKHHPDDVSSPVEPIEMLDSLLGVLSRHVRDESSQTGSASASRLVIASSWEESAW
jgi:hypothetical protein